MRWSAEHPGHRHVGDFHGRVTDHYDRRKARRNLKTGESAFAAGTGMPSSPRDSAACLRAIEIDADVVLKATRSMVSHR